MQASLWIVIFSYVGNYFWTHYFFTVLGASYTFPSWKMNNVSHNSAFFCFLYDYKMKITIQIFITSLQVPHTTFLLTNVCFLFYHVTSNLTLRRLEHSVAHLPVKTRWIIKSAWILALSYFIAFLETVAISNVRGFFPFFIVGANLRYAIFMNVACVLTIIISKNMKMFYI